MRLIDAHQIESILTYTEFDRDEKAPWLENEVEAYRHFLDIIQSAHTAYDVDKVIEELENPNNYTIIAGKHFTLVDRSVGIVRAGLKIQDR